MLILTVLSQDNVAGLAQVWHDSYVTLSQKYKEADEMICYTPAYFKQKADRLLSDQTSDVFVVQEESRVCGFARFSPVPASYHTHNTAGVSSETDIGRLNGHSYAWTRQIQFHKPVYPTEQTVMLNQIYLAPTQQHRGLGTRLLATALPFLSDTYRDLVVEYNVKNTGAQAFYRALGIQDIATTRDLDQITDKKTYFSDVSVAWTGLKPLNQLVTRKISHNHQPTLMTSNALLHRMGRQRVC